MSFCRDREPHLAMIDVAVGIILISASVGLRLNETTMLDQVHTSSIFLTLLLTSCVEKFPSNGENGAKIRQLKLKILCCRIIIFYTRLARSRARVGEKWLKDHL